MCLLPYEDNVSIIIKNRQEMPDEAKIPYDLCDKLGFRPIYQADFPIPDQRVQVRDELHNAPDKEVRKYALGMQQKGNVLNKFPPCVATRDGYIVDGNTRYAAARHNKRPDFPTLVLDVMWVGISRENMSRVHTLGAAFNVRNGRGIDKREIRNAVEEIFRADPSMDATRVAALVNVGAGVVHGIRAEMRAADRAKQVGLVINGELNATQWRKLGESSSSLNDEPFTALLELTKDAGLKPVEIGEIARRCREARSDNVAVDILTKEREARKDQIALYVFTGKSRAPLSATLRQKLGFILNHEVDPGQLVERNPTQTKDHLDMVQRAIQVLTIVQSWQQTYHNAGINKDQDYSNEPYCN